MTALMAVLCAAASAFLLPRGASPAARRLSHQFQSPLQRPRRCRGRRTAGPRRGVFGEASEPVRRLRALRPDIGGRELRHEALDGAWGRRPRPGADEAARRRDLQLRRMAAGMAGVICAVALGGVPGAMVGVLAAVAVWFSSGRSGSAERKRRRARLIADLPVAVDLLAACLRGGAPWHDAVAAVAEAVGGPLGDELQAVSVQIRLGADPAEAWLALAAEPMLAPLARAATRAASTGAALAPSLSRLARDQRRVARTAAAARARAAGIRALAPLGLCFLPAFVLLGVVPAVAGIASTILLPR